MLIELEYTLENFLKGKQAEPSLNLSKFMPKTGILSLINLRDFLSGHVQERRKNQEQSSTYKGIKDLALKAFLANRVPRKQSSRIVLFSE
jgi:hypothetical protein